ncbi:CHC2 zinc finger domain-containing protein [Crenobacter caeni]|nr:CHC2 zinc finger domain-containing protein [Crenobacter caeni]
MTDFFDAVRATLKHRAALGIGKKKSAAGERDRNGARTREMPANYSATGAFCRDLLPEAGSYYRQHFGDAMRATSRGWLVRCPFHDDKTPSAICYRADGGFHCFGCGVHCRDVLDFHQRMTGLSFKAAAQALGAWRAGR